RGARLGGAPAQILGRLTRFKEAALGDREALVRLTLRLLELGDRRAGFGLAAIDRVALLLRLPALEGELRRLLLDVRRFMRSALDLGLERDDRLLLLVMLGVQRRDRVLRLGDRGLERRGFLGEADEGFALRRDAIRQVLDLALGFENAARLAA